MNIIVCLDDKNGMLFNKRRQSSDCKLRERIFEITLGCKIWMNEYSAKQFTEITDINISENFLKKAEQGDYCFLENSDITEYISNIEKIIVYRWNRVYPADFYFPFDALTEKGKLVSVCDFKGKSHEKITEEIYEL